MSMSRLASFNVENLFDRPRAMNHSTWVDGAPVLAAHALLNQLIQKDVYDDATKVEMLVQLGALKLLHSDESTYARLRKIRGRFLARKKSGETMVVAGGRESWIGWIELTTEPVTALAMTHTGQVIHDVGAHVLGVVEAESRPLLQRFSSALMKEIGGTPYEQVLLLDGNDERGIDVGLMVRDGHRVTDIRTHIFDRDAKGVVFSRDCAEYHVEVRGKHRLVVLVNHLKSKGYGSEGDPIGAQRRFRQAAAIARIYDDLVADGVENIAVIGDLNDHPTSEALAPLFADGRLRDISEHPAFVWGPRKGTYKSGNESEKIDYVLLSPSLYARAIGGGVFRKGVWRGDRTKNKWEIYPTLTSEIHAASDHAAIYADIDWGE